MLIRTYHFKTLQFLTFLNWQFYNQNTYIGELINKLNELKLNCKNEDWSIASSVVLVHTTTQNPSLEDAPATRVKYTVLN